MKFLNQIVNKLLSPVLRFGDFTFYEKDLRLPLEPVTAQVDVQIIRGVEKDLDVLTEFTIQQLSDLQGQEEVRGDILKRLRAGQVCFVGKVEGKIVHDNWIIFDALNIPAIDLYFVLGEDQSSTDGCYTLEPFRGKGLHPAIKYEMLQFLKESGYSKDYCYAESSNISSHRSLIRAGYKVIGKLYSVKFRGLERVFIITKNEIRRFLQKDMSPRERESSR